MIIGLVIVADVFNIVIKILHQRCAHGESAIMIII
jgi:hypothetical protein